MSIPYCSACADTSSFAGDTCIHCGATAEAPYELTGHSLATLIIVLAMSIGTVWAFTKPDASYQPSIYPSDRITTNASDKLVQNGAKATHSNPRNRDA